MSNYPPGTSAGTPSAPWNQSSHEHDFHAETFLVDDGAVIFHQTCTEESQCEKGRLVRYDLSSITKVRDGQPDVEYLATEWTLRGTGERIDWLFEDIMSTVSGTFASNLNVVESTSPAWSLGDGEVVVEWRDYQLLFKE
jgi:hypothetical protein